MNDNSIYPYDVERCNSTLREYIDSQGKLYYAITVKLDKNQVDNWWQPYKQKAIIRLLNYMIELLYNLKERLNQ